VRNSKKEDDCLNCLRWINNVKKKTEWETFELLKKEVLLILS